MAPRRARFQIHLSTAILLMFVAGALIWAQTTPKLTSQKRTDPPGWSVVEYPRTEYGWPAVAYIYIDYSSTKIQPNQREWNYGGVQFDIVMAMIYLSGAGCLCEWLIRRRAARKGP
ncbi:MAG TPA: hypothetical protein VKX17_06585 [Planctomycetota bacterium]|nr:hypothetical protein [Planctomycetota bacterium]